MTSSGGLGLWEERLRGQEWRWSGVGGGGVAGFAVDFYSSDTWCQSDITAELKVSRKRELRTRTAVLVQARYLWGRCQ